MSAKVKNKIKALISVILCISIYFTVSAPVSVSAQKNAIGPDFGEKAYEFFKELGIIDENEAVYTGSKEVGRGWFVKLTLYLFKISPGSQNAAGGIFDDVNSFTEYGGYIEEAYRLGYISGTPGKNFEPDKTITMTQAIKILITALGYTGTAEASGGFPTGYMTVAGSCGLLDKISLEGDSPLDMSMAFTLLYNAVNTDIMKLKPSGNTIEWYTSKGETVLTEKYNIENLEGIVSTNTYTDLIAEESDVPENHVRIDDVIMDEGSSGAGDYLGYRVKVYYDNSSDVPVILHTELSDKNYLVVCDVKDLERSGSNIKYTPAGGKSQNIKLSSDVTYILNGKMSAMTVDELVDTEKGNAIFISNDGDRSADVVIVTSYKTYVVSGVSESSDMIAVKGGSAIYIDPDDSDYVFTVTKDGETAEPGDIVADSVILVAESQGKGLNKKDIVLSTNSVTGTITRIDDESVWIDNEEYKADTKNGLSVNVGMVCTCLIDALGYAVYAYSENDIVYGFLYAFSNQDSEKVYCKIFTENNRWVELYLKEHIKLNGNRVSSAEAYKLITDEYGTDYKQMIRYKVNADAEITMIDTAENIAIGTDAEEKAIDDDIFRKSYTGTAAWRSASKSFDGKFFADASTKIFVASDDYAADEFRIIPVTKFVGDRSYSVTAYNVDEYLKADVMLVKSMPRTVGAGNRFMIVKNTRGTTLNSDEEAVPALRGYWNGHEVSFPVKIGIRGVSEDVYESLNKGDVIQFSYDDSGNVDFIRIHTPDDEEYYLYGSSLYISYNVIAGNVKKCDKTNNRIKLLYSSGGKSCGLAFDSSAKVYIYEKGSETYTAATVSEILEGDRIFATMAYLVCKEILIIRD